MPAPLTPTSATCSRSAIWNETLLKIWSGPKDLAKSVTVKTVEAAIVVCENSLFAVARDMAAGPDVMLLQV